LDACFVVRDHAGQELGYVYFEDEPGADHLGSQPGKAAGCPNADGFAASLQMDNSPFPSPWSVEELAVMIPN
jgi:hypothetical protein